jgi:hypothetical protein
LEPDLAQHSNIDCAHELLSNDVQAMRYSKLSASTFPESGGIHSLTCFRRM